MKIINPATEEIIKEIAADDAVSIRVKYEMVRKGQELWLNMALEERISRIEKFGELVTENIDTLAHTLTMEVGKPLRQSFNEIKGAQGRIKFFTKNSEKWLKDEWTEIAGTTRELVRYEPLGVVANISAWNYPYNVGYNVFLPALIAGNGVLYKPSEYASLTGLEITRLLYEAGVPKDVFQCIIGGPESGDALLKLPLNGYFFTGSYKTGKYIAEQVAGKMVPVQLELGGKDPLYVTDDVRDIKKAAVDAAEGAFYNSGQSCCAVERIYVHENIYEKFVEEFINEVKQYKTGNPLAEDTFIGPLTRKQQIVVLTAQLQEAERKGAKIVYGSKYDTGKGNYFTPAVVIDANNEMRIMREESFGPVIGINKVSGDSEAVELMKDTEYGLTAAVFTENFDRADRIFKEMDTGTVYWNCCDRVSPSSPWSGRKNSGMGSTLSYQGIRVFVRPKAYHLRAS